MLLKTILATIALFGLNFWDVLLSKTDLVWKNWKYDQQKQNRRWWKLDGVGALRSLDPVLTNQTRYSPTVGSWQLHFHWIGIGPACRQSAGARVFAEIENQLKAISVKLLHAAEKHHGRKKHLFLETFTTKDQTQSGGWEDEHHVV